MSADPQPNTHAIIAHVADAASAEAALSALTDEVGIYLDRVTHGTGQSFAAKLNSSREEKEAKSRIAKWLLSLGQEREELVRLAEVVKDDRYGIVINDVDRRDTLDAVVAVLKRHDAKDIVYFGEWQTEDLSINRAAT